MALLELIIVLACLQLMILLVLVCATFFIKWRLDRQAPIKARRRLAFQQALMDYPNISSETFQALQTHLHMTFVVFLELEPHLTERKQILIDLFLNKVWKLAHAPIWYDRYMAAVLLQYINRYRLDFDGQALLIYLLHDKVALVAIHAFQAVAYHPNTILFNEIIEVFSTRHRSQMELFMSVLQHADLTLVDLIVKRLTYEKIPVVRCFCYRLLNGLPMVSYPMPYLVNDIHHECLDLALASITYLFYAKKPFYKKHLFTLLSDSRWQIRARCLKYLGRTQDVKLSQHLATFLSDNIWWVRFRAAEALSHLGQQGRDVLYQAACGEDKFAKAIAWQRLEQEKK